VEILRPTECKSRCRERFPTRDIQIPKFGGFLCPFFFLFSTIPNTKTALQAYDVLTPNSSPIRRIREMIILKGALVCAVSDVETLEVAAIADAVVAAAEDAADRFNGG